jgi:recombination protein RecA
MAKQKEVTSDLVLDAAIKSIEKDFGKGTIMLMSSERVEDIEVIPTGSVGLDLALGVGGWPKGRIVEIYGPEASGKTTACLHAIAEAQKLFAKEAKETGKPMKQCAFIDVEHALEVKRAKIVGADLDNVFLSQPSCAEEALQIIERLVRTGQFGLVILDSVAGLAPKNELAGEMGDNHVALVARAMSQAMRKLVGVTKDTNTVLMFTNQTRNKIGVMFGSPETTPGGMALKFAASVRVRFVRIGNIKNGTAIIGQQVKAEVKKNKVAPPFKTCEIPLIFSEGFSYMEELFDAAMDNDIITKSGAHFSMGDIKIGHGRNAALLFLKNSPDILDKLKEDIEKIARG